MSESPSKEMEPKVLGRAYLVEKLGERGMSRRDSVRMLDFLFKEMTTAWTGSVSQDLAQMSMICFLNLVLDQYPIVVSDVLTQDICAERPNFLLLSLKFQFEIDRLA